VASKCPCETLSSLLGLLAWSVTLVKPEFWDLRRYSYRRPDAHKAAHNALNTMKHCNARCTGAPALAAAFMLPQSRPDIFAPYS